MFIKYVLFFTIFIIVTQKTDSSRILGVFWTPSRSHHILGSALLQALAKKGHDVTLLTPFVDDVNITNFKQKKLEGIIGALDLMLNMNATFLDKARLVFSYARESSRSFWQNDVIREQLQSKEKFDVIIFLNFFNDGIVALGNFLKTPVIIFSSSGSNPLINKYVANPNLPYGINPQSSNGKPGTFFGRLFSTSAILLMGVLEKFVLNPQTYDVVKEYNTDCPSVAEIQKNIALVLVNSHYSIEAPRPYVPNMIQIGGFYAQSVKPLPDDLKKYLDSAKDGAVLLSFGTNMKIENMDQDKLDAILKGLEKISPMKVLFKSEIELKNAPKNVLVKNWIPQNDILAHPNIKAFISHGGLGGTTEAVYHGVPMLGIPLFADQKSNIKTAEDSGYAVPLFYDDITQESFDKALKELLTNPKYTKTAKKRSSLLRNQPMNPLDKAIWWVEHIIEHKGGEHLRNIGMDMEWYQLYMVDIMLFYLVVLCLIGTITFYITRCVLRRIYRRIFKKVKKE